MTTPAILCRGVSGGYAGSTTLQEISCEIQAGEMVGVLGPNGAGKTSLFRLLTGLLPWRQGTLELFGKTLAGLPAEERAQLIGVVPQEIESPMPFTVAEIVLMGRTSRLNRWRTPAVADWHKVEEALAYTDVRHLQERYFHELSGGEKQRVLIAMVLAQDPRIVLLDEATSHLDISHRLEILELVERLNRDTGVTVLMTSHDLGLTAEFARRLLLLNGGRIVADGAPEEVLQRSVVSEVFRCELRIRRDPETGTIGVFPVRRLHAQPAEGRGPVLATE